MPLVLTLLFGLGAVLGVPLPLPRVAGLVLASIIGFVHIEQWML